ncbi:methyltransferase domain-containing protein [Marinobacter sp. SS13-12]|uniref:methyltransferase domain-containing protein n=1 Tax=Marinobacter sp. SS13-12 TaxID=3050451 RepID=UPI0025545992|nr:methyltransferase domain-containing protein [Marinobacter sp. SS13-12]MDK8465391.1 methyltransferase domain-containing protein [Marinobacter sp. SS13-12]
MTIAPYNRNAQTYFAQYQSLTFEQVHSDWLSELNQKAGLALDVGAGSGRDSSALAARGWDVVAVEPAAGLRELGQDATRSQSIHWVDDQLPDLGKIQKLSYRFDLILVSAVWMHIPPSDRERAFRILTELLAPGGMLVITLRHGPGDGERLFYDVSREELEVFAKRRALIPLLLPVRRNKDELQRDEVSWETLAFRLADDGTGALPTVRHIIVNDNKSSTYKLGLLRTLVRIADGAPGLALNRTDDWVEIPLGAVGLFWIMLYHPLVLRHQLRQAPGSRGYGFATDDFFKLQNFTPLDFRVGMSLSEDVAPVVLRAIRDACSTILKNPAHFTTWPGSNRPVFEGGSARMSIKKAPVRLDKATLSRFGTFRVPSFLWDAFSRYACWIEPAIVNEWIDLMGSWDLRYSMDVYHRGLQWVEGRRDTSAVRQLINQQLETGRVECVWTAQNLKAKRFDVDHCFPWSRWNNNDLWNLMPATHTANASKSEKLPGDLLLKEAHPRVVNWWEQAIVGTSREEQFFSEAEASLPLLGQERTLEGVFEGMLQQRLRLKTNLQLAEWLGG